MDYSDCRDHFSEGQDQRMYDNWIEFHTKTAPCLDGEVRIGIDLLFDASSTENAVRYIAWGEAGPAVVRTLTIGRSLANYANKQAVDDFCVPANSMVELFVEDSASNGFTAGSYVAFRLNNQEVVRYTDWDSDKLAVLLAADTETCGDDTLPFRMSLGLDNAPQFKEWSLLDATGNLVVDQSVTAIEGNNAYTFLHRGRGVFYSICLPYGTYQFVLTDRNNDPVGISAPGYLELFVDEVPVYTNAGSTPSGAELIVDLFVGVTATPVAAPTPLPTTTSPTTSPTTVPTVVPTPVPTMSSTPINCPEGTFFIPGIGCLCFSGDSTVETASGAHVAIKDIRVGDAVKATNGRFEAIYTFGHYAPDATGDFLEISTSSGNDQKTIRLSPSHMIRTSAGEYVPASAVQIGDFLYGTNTNSDVPQQVTKLDRVQTKGVYAPFTPSGTIVVDGIEASTYVSFTDTGRLTIAGIHFSGQWLAHTFEFPHRVMCYHLTTTVASSSLCSSYNDAGVSTFVAAPLDFFSYITTQAPKPVFTTVMGASILVLILFQLVELVVFQQPLLFLVVTAFALIYAARRKSYN